MRERERQREGKREKERETKKERKRQREKERERENRLTQRTADTDTLRYLVTDIIIHAVRYHLKYLRLDSQKFQCEL